MLYKQRKAKPYKIINGVKKTTFNIRNVPGVYLIYENDFLVYVGYSESNLYKTMYRHFQDWSTSKQYRAIYNPDKVLIRVIYTKTGGKAKKLETALIIKYKPRDNANLYLNFEADEKEEKVFKEYLDENTEPIAEYKSDLPF